MGEKQILADKSTFETILDIVSSVAEVSSEEILSKSKVAEVVDARHIVVQLLSEQGWYQSRIARKMSIGEGAVSRMLSKFDERCQYRGFYINKVLEKSRKIIREGFAKPLSKHC